MRYHLVSGSRRKKLVKLSMMRFQRPMYMLKMAEWAAESNSLKVPSILELMASILEVEVQL